MESNSSANSTASSSAINDEKADFKRISFDREVRKLMEQAVETIQARYGMSIELGEAKSELVCLNRYQNIYVSMRPEEHYCYFETLYNRNRSSILNCLKDDRWIRTGRLVIQFGEGIKGMAEKCKNIRINLSDIFLIACDLQSAAKKSLDGIDETLAHSAGNKDLIRPNILLLHLIRIFYYLNDGSDKDQLGTIVTQLEDDLGVTKRTVETASTTPSNAQQTPAGAATGGLSSLFTMATSMMEKMGYKPPPGMKAPTESEISNVIGSVFNNPTTQNAIQGMFTSLQGCQDFGSAVQTVVQNVTDPSTMSAIQDSVLQTAQSASFVNQVPTGPTAPNV